MTIFDLANFAGVFIFAATGALAASRRELDIIGFIFLANLTGIGGGTIRDLILGDNPVFWTREPIYLLAGTLAAIVVYFTAHLFESRYRALLWCDAIGMSAYSVMGAAKGLTLGFSPFVAIVTGVFTATMGGVMRDIVAGEPSVVMRREIYLTAALAGACLYVILDYFSINPAVSAIIAATTAFIVRGGALYFGWKLPTYKAQPGRTEEELKRDRIID